MKGADVSLDHFLLVTTVRLRLKRHNINTNARKKFNVRLLRSMDTRAVSVISLSNRFQPLQELIEDCETEIKTQCIA
jgi:hypothetical protein